MSTQSARWYAVVGDPVKHSKSPQIHTAFAEQVGIDLDYRKIQIPKDAFEKNFSQLIDEGLAGANVTVPHKFAAYNMATETTRRAHLAQAANTLIIKPDGIIADNTDGVGLITDIETNANFPLADKHLLIIGAGGAVSGVLPAILDQKPASLTLYNRTLSKAEALVAQFSHLTNTIPFSAKSLDALHTVSVDCIINGSSASLTGENLPLPESLFHHCLLVYDMMYGKSLPFLDKAKALGAQTVRDGLGMLVEQAAESFYIWHGIKPETAPVLTLLRNTLF